MKPCIKRFHLAIRARQHFFSKVWLGVGSKRIAVRFLNSLLVNLGVSEFVIAVGANQQPFTHLSTDAN
jgi:hypothetical protein